MKLDNIWLPAAKEQFKQNSEDMHTIHSGGMVTEMFGPSCDKSYAQTAVRYEHMQNMGTEEYDQALAEAHQTSYLLWQYKSFCEESERSVKSDSQHAEFGACKTGGGCGFFNNEGKNHVKGPVFI